MHWVIDLAVVIAYFVMVTRLSDAAYEHLRDPERDLWHPPIFDPEKFHPAGEPLRRRAIRVSTLGGIAVVLYFVILS